MTPIEKLIADGVTAALERFWYEQAAFEKRAKEEIKAAAEHARRSLGQRFRHLTVALKGKT